MAPSVRVLFFATAREAVGHRELQLAVGPGGTAAVELLRALAHQYPRLAGVVRGSRLVVNGRFVDGTSVVVRPGDELAIHPPYSGG